MARARSAGAAALSHGGPGPPKQGLVRRLGLSRSPAGCRGGFPSSLWLPGSRNVHLNEARLPHFCPEPSPRNPRFQGKLSCKQHTRRVTPRHSPNGYGHWAGGSREIAPNPSFVRYQPATNSDPGSKE
ncbi:hypothetical protein MG293_010741 [Ovis ammon polii]|uniref:Uncharacterized protein n=1 Tax=Ovis ammon polii TaxID=230172 RepID=A0AAD4Y966_OVIAM|nr:hypothetical protein MG293_010741 [Ovis ammon polii]